MAETEHLIAQSREATGSRAARRLRREGLIPAVLYGHGTESVALSLQFDQVQAALRHGAHLVDVKYNGKAETALLREVQWDTFGQEILHVDLARVSAGERITVEVPLELRGSAPGVKEGGRLEQYIHAVEVECLATAIPDSLRVSINDLHLNASITVGDLEVPSGVVIQHSPDSLVVQVIEVHEAAEAEEAEHEPVEPELIRKEKEAVSEEG